MIWRYGMACGGAFAFGWLLGRQARPDQDAAKIGDDLFVVALNNEPLCVCTNEAQVRARLTGKVRKETKVFRVPLV